MRRQVVNAVDAGDGDWEIRRLRERVTGRPADVEARLELARAYAKRGYPELEIEHYRVAAERFPDSGDAALALAKALRNANANSEALDVLAGFCNRNPSAPADLFSWVGILADDAGDTLGAERWHRAALARQPEQDSLHNNLGYNLLLQGTFEPAAVEFRRALELNPRSGIARSNLGIALAASSQAAVLQDAVLQWQSLSDPATAHNNLAAVLMERKRYAEARLEIQKALAFSPKHAAARNNLELLAELDGKGAKAGPAPNEGWRRVSSVLRRALGASN